MMLVKMEESQMQELFHDEQTQSVPTTAVSGQSQTRSAQYARQYRKNPEKNRKINEDRRRNYKMKKEGQNNASAIFMESEAAPATNAPRTVENFAESNDISSLAEPSAEASHFTQFEVLRMLAEMRKEMENRDKQRNEQIKMVEDAVTKILNFPDNPMLAKQNEAIQKLEKEWQEFRALMHEIKATSPALPSNNLMGMQGTMCDELYGGSQEKVRPTAPALPKINDTEQQASVSGIAITNGANLSKKKTIAKLIVEKLPTLGVSLLILTFLVFNTYFLVSEQRSLYESMSYSSGMALLISLLSEASLIMLSTMASWTTNLEWKLGLTAGMVLTVAVMVGILDSSAKSRVNTAARQSQEAKNIEKQLSTLRALEAPILTRIEKLDPQHYRTEISRLSSQLTTPPNGYSYKIEQLSNRLASINTAEADIGKLVWQRRVALLLNLLLSGFLGFLWSKNQSSVLTKIGIHLSNYFKNPCVL